MASSCRLRARCTHKAWRLAAGAGPSGGGRNLIIGCAAARLCSPGNVFPSAHEARYACGERRPPGCFPLSQPSGRHVREGGDCGTTMDIETRDRQVRVGRNQSLFREVNERIEGLKRDSSPGTRSTSSASASSTRASSRLASRSRNTNACAHGRTLFSSDPGTSTRRRRTSPRDRMATGSSRRPVMRATSRWRRASGSTTPSEL